MIKNITLLSRGQKIGIIEDILDDISLKEGGKVDVRNLVLFSNRKIEDLADNTSTLEIQVREVDPANPHSGKVLIYVDCFIDSTTDDMKMVKVGANELTAFASLTYRYKINP